MAQPVPLEIPARDLHAEFENRLQRARAENSEALLAGYQVLQALHRRGILDLLAGSFGSADKVLPMLVDAAKTPEAVRGIRNLLALGKFICNLEPEMLQGLTQSAAAMLGSAKTEEPLSIWQLAKKMRSKDTRRALTAITCTLEAFGKSIGGAAPKDQRSA